MDGAVPRLRWSHSDSAAHHYEAWRSTSPYFVPGVAGSDTLRLRTIPAPALGAVVEFSDTAIPPDGRSYYYAIVAVNSVGARSVASVRSGLVRFSLAPGQ